MPPTGPPIAWVTSLIEVDRRRLVIDDVAVQRVPGEHLAADDRVGRLVVRQARPQQRDHAQHDAQREQRERVAAIHHDVPARRTARPRCTAHNAGTSVTATSTHASSPMIASTPNEDSARLSAGTSEA